MLLFGIGFSHQLERLALEIQNQTVKLMGKAITKRSLYLQDLNKTTIDVLHYNADTHLQHMQEYNIIFCIIKRIIQEIINSW